MMMMDAAYSTLEQDHHQEPDAPAAWRYDEILTSIRRELQSHESTTRSDGA